MKEKEFRAYLESRKQPEASIEAAAAYVRELETYLEGLGRELNSVAVDDIKAYAIELIAGGANTIQRFLALARYAYATDMNEVYIYFTRILEGLSVLESISERLEELAGKEAREQVFSGLDLPQLGAPPEAYPPVTAELTRRLEQLGMGKCHDVLAGNHHRIPVEGFAKHKTWLEEAGSLDAFLKRVHAEAVAELERHLEEGKVWYEQLITPEIVEYVRANQEVLSAVREGKYLYKTKFPYAPEEWLKEKDPLRRRYFACHCPLAREAIVRGEPDIPLDWCYCSGGYGKLMFDVVFGQPTEVEVLESVLAGDDRCRFRIRIPSSHIP
jgi:hypothetical protein